MAFTNFCNGFFATLKWKSSHHRKQLKMQRNKLHHSRKKLFGFPDDIRMFPKAMPRKQILRNRQRGRSIIATDTPKKILLELSKKKGEDTVKKVVIEKAKRKVRSLPLMQFYFIPHLGQKIF